MASTAASLKRTSERQTLGPIGAERRRLGTTGGEVGWPDSRFSPFSGDVPFYSFNGAEFLESISSAASRGRRRPRAGTWSRLPGILGQPTPGKAKLSRPGGPGGVRREAAHPGTTSQPIRGTALFQHLQSTSDPAKPPRAPASSARISVLQSLQGRTSRPLTGRGVGVPNPYSCIFSLQRPSAPRPVAPAGPGSWRTVGGQ